MAVGEWKFKSESSVLRNPDFTLCSLLIWKPSNTEWYVEGVDCTVARCGENDFPDFFVCSGNGLLKDSLKFSECLPWWILWIVQTPGGFCLTVITHFILYQTRLPNSFTYLSIFHLLLHYANPFLLLISSQIKLQILAVTHTSFSLVTSPYILSQVSIYFSG